MLKRITTIFYFSRCFLVFYLLFFSFSAFCLLYYAKHDIHLFINQFHYNFFDVFFKYFTHLGDGFFVLFLVVLLLFYRYRFALLLGIANIGTAIVIQILKRFVFSDYMRPVAELRNQLYLIDGVDMHELFSFPSGHTASAFTTFFIIAVWVKKPIVSIACLFAAVLVAYSRMYLSLHYLQDVFFGSVIGLVIAICTVVLYFKKLQPNDK